LVSSRPNFHHIGFREEDEGVVRPTPKALDLNKEMEDVEKIGGMNTQ
jgi:hypothetical protein